MRVHTVIHRKSRDNTDTIGGHIKQLFALAMGGICVKKRHIIDSDELVDEFTGMTQTERDLILKSWHKITEKESLVKVGMTFFLKLFAIYPYLQDYFSFLSERSISITSSLKFRSHVLKFMYGVTAFVENVDDPDTLQSLMTKISEMHVVLNITYDDMQRMREVFLEFMQDMLGKDSKSSAIVAWDKLFIAFLQTYATALTKNAITQQQQQQQQQSQLQQQQQQQQPQPVLKK